MKGIFKATAVATFIVSGATFVFADTLLPISGNFVTPIPTMGSCSGAWGAYNATMTPVTLKALNPANSGQGSQSGVFSGLAGDNVIPLASLATTQSLPVGNYMFGVGCMSGGQYQDPVGYGYFYWNGSTVSSSIANASTTSYIVDYTSPITSPTGSTVVPFTFDYWNTGYEGFDKVGVEIRDVTAGYNYAPVEDSVISTGQDTYTQDYVLVQGHAHLWRPYLRNSASSTIPTLYGNWVGLIDVVTDSASSTPYITENASTTAFFDFLNVPTLLRTKLPFAYIYQFSDIISGLSSTTASTTGSVTYDFAEYASGTPLASIGEFTLFSTTTVTQFLSPTLLSLFRTLLVAILYMTALFAIFHDVRNIKL